MTAIAGTVIAAILSFAATNVDDLFINMLFFAQADTPRKTQQVAAGKYLGIGALFFLSLAGAWFAHSLPYGILRLLGFIPLLLGIKALVCQGEDDEEPASHDAVSASDNLVMSTALVTIANGADNLGVYIPLLAGYGAAQVIVTAVIFVVMTTVWCLVSRRLADLPLLRSILTRYRHVAVPAVLIALGIYILL